MERNLRLENSAPRNLNQPGRLQLLQPVVISAEAVPDDEDVLTVSDMRQFANFLANEMNFNTFAATWEPPAWYREQVGPELCTEAQGVLLRTMTIKRCNEGSSWSTTETTSGTGLWARHKRWAARHSESLDAFGLIAALLFLLVVLPLLMKGR